MNIESGGVLDHQQSREMSTTTSTTKIMMMMMMTKMIIIIKMLIIIPILFLIIVGASGSLYLSGACSAATVTSFGPNNSLHPSTASSRAKQSAIIGPLQTSNITISSEWRLGAWSIEGPPPLAASQRGIVQSRGLAQMRNPSISHHKKEKKLAPITLEY